MKAKKNVLFFVIGVQLCVIICISVYLLDGGAEAESPTVPISYVEMSQETDPSWGPNLPFKYTVKGKGRVIPSSNYVHVGAPRGGFIRDLAVKVGQTVQAGDLLFTLDDTHLQHELKERRAQHQTALSQLELLDQGPSLASLQVKEKEMEYIRWKAEAQSTEHELYDQLYEQKVVSLRERKEKEVHTKLCEMELEKVKAEYAAMKEGVSPLARQVQASVVQEKALACEALQEEMIQCQVVAPITGKVLALEKQKGEYLYPQDAATVVLGSDTPVHLEVFVDEESAWKITPQSSLRAIAFHQNNPQMHFVLEYVGVSPILQEQAPDSGKLRLLFAFDKQKAPIYLEQKLDVYIESNSPEDTAFLDYQFNQLRF